MHSPTSLNRRQWLKATGTAFAGLALAPRISLRAEPAAADALPQPAPAGPVQLCWNENPFGPSPLALAAMAREVPRVHRYPFNLTPKLVERLAALEGVTPEHIVPGVGSGEILETYGVYLGRQGGDVITASPGYTQMTGAMERMGSRVVAVPLTAKLEYDLDAMAAKITPNTKAVYICNPNNPSGTIVEPARLRAFVIEVAKQVPVFIDEAYLQCSDHFAANTMVGLVREGHNVTVARTFSKLYGLAGQRMGYGIMPPEMAKGMREFMTGSVNLLGVVGALASLDDAAYVEATRLKIKAGRDALIGVLQEFRRPYAEPQGNFVFFHTGVPIKEFAERMLAENVIVARGFPPLTDWCRISIGSPAEMAVCHTALRKVLSA